MPRNYDFINVDFNVELCSLEEKEEVQLQYRRCGLPIYRQCSMLTTAGAGRLMGQWVDFELSFWEFDIEIISIRDGPGPDPGGPQRSMRRAALERGARSLGRSGVSTP